MPGYTHSFLPHLIRAAYDWLVENGLTPYIEIATDSSQVVVPQQYVENNRIILDISPNAINQLKMTDIEIKFNARFGNNKIYFISTPWDAITTIYDPQHGYGIRFQPTLNLGLPLEVPPPPKPKISQPKLVIIRNSSGKTDEKTD